MQAMRRCRYHGLSLKRFSDCQEYVICCRVIVFTLKQRCDLASIIYIIGGQSMFEENAELSFTADCFQLLLSPPPRPSQSDFRKAAPLFSHGILYNSISIIHV